MKKIIVNVGGEDVDSSLNYIKPFTDNKNDREHFVYFPRDLIYFFMNKNVLLLAWDENDYIYAIFESQLDEGDNYLILPSIDLANKLKNNYYLTEVNLF